MPAARCVLCDRLLMVGRAPSTNAVANPDALVLCAVCEALPMAERRRRRDQIMLCLLGDKAEAQRRRA